MTAAPDVAPVLPARVRRQPIEQARERVLALLTDPAPPLGPSVEPCVCGAPRWEHTGPSRSGKCPRTDCSRYRRDLVDSLVEKALAGMASTFGDDLKAYERRERSKRIKRPEGTLGIGPSDTTSCPRKIEYRERPPADFVPDPEDKRPARIGGMIHRDWQTVSQALYPWRLHEYGVTIPGLDTPNSRVDRYDPVTAVLDDGKTAGNWAWDNLAASGPEEAVWEQVMVYGLALTRMGLPVRTVRLVYIKRENGHDEVFERPYDEEMAQRALDRLLGYAAVLDAGGHLPRGEGRTGPSTDGLCRGCFARTHCWNLTRAAALGRSGESLTILGETPEDAEVEFFAAGVYDAKQRKTAAEKQEKEGLAILEGVAPGTYGAFEVGEGGRWMPDLKRKLAAVEAHYVEPDGTRPPLAEIETPKRRDSWTTVKPVRAAKRAKGKAPTPPPTPDEVLQAAQVEPVIEAASTDEASA